jgi:hypothetical protein
MKVTPGIILTIIAALSLSIASLWGEFYIVWSDLLLALKIFSCITLSLVLYMAINLKGYFE